MNTSVPTHMSNGDRELLLAMERHLDDCYGRRERNVFHELISPLIHVDIHVIAPSDHYPLTRLVTCGMAELPMTVPSTFSRSPYAELTIALPPDWPITRRLKPDPRIHWPLLVLQELARIPHQHKTFFWDGHTIPWGVPAEPFAPNTELSNLVILPPSEAPEQFDEFRCGDRTVNILGLIPLHQDELEFCHDQGVEALYERLDAAGVPDVVDPSRPSVLGS
jgi:Suppressor of fused protein (SUFU)